MSDSQSRSLLKKTIASQKFYNRALFLNFSLTMGLVSHLTIYTTKVIILLSICCYFSSQWLLLRIEYHSQPNHDQLHRPSGCHICQWILPQQCLAGGSHMPEQCHRRTTSGANSWQVNNYDHNAQIYTLGLCPSSSCKAMTYNIPVSHPLKCHLPMRAGSYYLLCYYILFCTKPTYLTARVWPFTIHFQW